MNRPWMPLYIAHYRADTMHLGAAEHGAYLLLIMHYWLSGALPDDDRQLARIACMTTKEWAKARATIQAFFQDGWKHKRIDAEMKKTADVSESYASRARLAANKRWSSNAPSNAPSMLEASIDGCLEVPILPLQRSKEDTADAVPSSVATYVFESGVIKLKQKAFDQWKQAYSHLDLAAELLALTEWAGGQPKWFFAVSGALAKRNRDVAVRIEQQKTQPAFKWNGIEGVI